MALLFKTKPKPPPENVDALVLDLVDKKPNLLVPHFLMHSFLYYVLDQPVVSDDTFDQIAARLEARWDNVQHPHKALIDPAQLKTGFYLKYPLRVEHGARWFAANAQKLLEDRARS